MTGTDERRNSHSRSGTPSRGDNLVPQPVFQSHPGIRSHSGTPQALPAFPSPIALVHAPQMEGVESSAMDDDPFRMIVPDHHGINNLNDDMPEMQNVPQWVVNIPYSTKRSTLTGG